VKRILLSFAAAALSIAAIFFLRTLAQQNPAATPKQASEEVNRGAAPGQQAPVSPAEQTPDSEFSSLDRKQAETLQSILASHNDNDMRLDTELKVLSPGAKKLFRQKYDQINAEKRNQRGTVVYLLGRNLTQPSDIAFMAKVLAEPPCRSMQSCTSDPPHSGDPEADLGIEVTLAYPQIRALLSLETVLASGSENPLYEQAMETVHKATQSPVAKVANMARAIEAKYSRH
jgi:hypothetical protein